MRHIAMLAALLAFEAAARAETFVPPCLGHLHAPGRQRRGRRRRVRQRHRVPAVQLRLGRQERLAPPAPHRRDAVRRPAGAQANRLEPRRREVLPRRRPARHVVRADPGEAGQRGPAPDRGLRPGGRRQRVDRPAHRQRNRMAVAERADGLPQGLAHLDEARQAGDRPRHDPPGGRDHAAPDRRRRQRGADRRRARLRPPPPGGRRQPARAGRCRDHAGRRLAVQLGDAGLRRAGRDAALDLGWPCSWGRLGALGPRRRHLGPGHHLPGGHPDDHDDQEDIIEEVNTRRAVTTGARMSPPLYGRRRGATLTTR